MDNPYMPAEVKVSIASGREKEELRRELERVKAQQDNLLAICEEVCKEQYRKAMSEAVREVRVREPTLSEVQSYLPRWAILMENAVLKAKGE